MRFCSLYRYSYGKSPKDLRAAVIACKLALSLTIVAGVLFIVAIFSYYYHHDHQNHSSESSVATANAPIANGTSESNTFARHQEEYSHNSSSPLARYIADYSVSLCLISGAILCALTLASIGYAYLTYRRYLQSRLVSYQLVNRSFDQLQLEQLAKVHIRQPIITQQNGATVLVPKNSPVPEWLQQQEASSSNRSKFVIWARSKWTRANRTRQHNNNNPKRSISKDMTI